MSTEFFDGSAPIAKVGDFVQARGDGTHERRGLTGEVQYIEFDERLGEYLYEVLWEGQHVGTSVTASMFDVCGYVGIGTTPELTPKKPLRVFIIKGRN